jgi:hypothetical protein
MIEMRSTVSNVITLASAAVTLGSALGMPAVRAATSYDLEVRGYVVVAQYSSNSVLSGEQTYGFEAWIQDFRWLILTKQMRSEEEQMVTDHTIVGTDGTNVYTMAILNPDFDQEQALRRELLRIEERLQNKHGVPANALPQLAQARDRLQRAMKVRHGRVVNQAVGRIDPVPYPRYGPDQVLPVWLAYCSHSFLDANAVFLPRLGFPELPPHQPGSELQNAQVVRSQLPPGLPITASYISPGVRFAMEDGQLRQTPLPAPFNRGFTNAQYRVAASTNHAGIVVPTAFELNRFMPRVSRLPTVELSLVETVKGFVTNVSAPSSRSVFIPDAPVVAAIQDNRFAAPLQYLLQPGPWQPHEDAVALLAFQEGLRLADESRRTLRQRVVIITMALLVAIGPVCWLMRFHFGWGHSKETATSHS